MLSYLRCNKIKDRRSCRLAASLKINITLPLEQRGFYLFWRYICLFNAKLRQLLALKESSWTDKQINTRQTDTIHFCIYFKNCFNKIHLLIPVINAPLIPLITSITKVKYFVLSRMVILIMATMFFSKLS